jgi:hypothetical protein
VGRVGLLVLAAAGLSLLGTPQITRPIDRYKLGEFTVRSIRAPYDLSVVDEETTRQQRAAAAAAALPVGVLDTQAGARLEARFAQAWATLVPLLPPEAPVPATPRAGTRNRAADERTRRLAVENRRRVEDAFPEVQRRLGTEIPPAVRATIEDRDDLARLIEGFGVLVNDAYRTPLVTDARVFDRLRPGGGSAGAPAGVVLVDRASGLEVPTVEASGLREVTAARTALRSRAAELVTGLAGPAVDWLITMAAAWLGPNVTADEAATLARRRAAADAVLPVSLAFRRNELIVGEGQPVTRQTLLVLDLLRQQRLDRDTWRRLAGRAGVILSLLLVAFWMPDRGERTRLGIQTRHFTYLVVSLVGTAVAFRLWVEVVGSLAARYPGLPEPAFLMAFPAAASVMYARMILPFQAATLYLGVQSLCLGLLWQLDLLYVIYLLVSGGIAGLLVWACSRRQCVVRAGVLAGLVMIPLSACLTLLTDWRGAILVWTTAGAVVGCVLSGIVVLAVGPLFEWIFGHLTRIRLVELMNYQHPLLRRITEVTPGTFQHSVTVGLLTDAAANAIGADALLARVGALYHDAGKTERPDCFTENQQGGNPHDHMAPIDSARAIIGHVEAGVRLVRKFGLGERVADFVREHHGTSTVRSFLVKAQQGGDPVDPGDFRYPGPRPRSRETAILMIADQVEATARSMDAPSEDDLRAMVRATIERNQGERQFDDCPLSLQELATIGDTLTQVLASVHHRRIKYPTAVASSPSAP